METLLYYSLRFDVTSFMFRPCIPKYSKILGAEVTGAASGGAKIRWG